jgi:hypothetical protein
MRGLIKTPKLDDSDKLLNGLYTFLNNSIDSPMINVIYYNNLLNSIYQKHTGVTENTRLFITNERYLSKYIFYLEDNRSYLIKKKGFKAWLCRLIGGLLDKPKYYEKGLENPLLLLSQIKLERKVYEFSDDKYIMLFIHYSKVLDLFIICSEYRYIIR